MRPAGAPEGQEELEEEEEEEEEEENFPRPVRQSSGQRYRLIEEEELDEPGQEDVVRMLGHFAQGTYNFTRGQQDAHGGGAPLLQAPLLQEHDHWKPAGAPNFVGGSTNSMWRQVFLGVLVLAGGLQVMSNRCPDEASFEALRKARYDGGRGGSRGGAETAEWPWLRDRSFQGQVAWSQYVNHGPLALAKVRLKVSANHTEMAGAKAPLPKLYDHIYLGLLGSWVPLPYLPQPGKQPGFYGAGLCVLGRCICVPNVKKMARMRRKGKAGATGGEEKGAGAWECWRFKGGKSAALNVMSVPNIAFLILWQFPKYWAALSGHATLSMMNLSRGRVWVLLAAPFSHRSWGEILHTGLLLANTIDSFDHAGISFAVYLGLYLMGSWAAWLCRSVLWKRVLKGDHFAAYEQEMGAAGGFSAQLVFLARVMPDTRFTFSMLFVPIPLDLSAWQSVLAHILVGLGTNTHNLPGHVFANIGACAVGWAFASAWLRHT